MFSSVVDSFLAYARTWRPSSILRLALISHSWSSMIQLMKSRKVEWSICHFIFHQMTNILSIAWIKKNQHLFCKTSKNRVLSSDVRERRKKGPVHFGVRHWSISSQDVQKVKYELQIEIQFIILLLTCKNS